MDCRACGRGALALRGELFTCNTCDAQFRRTAGTELAFVLAEPPRRFAVSRRGRSTTLALRSHPIVPVFGALLVAISVVGVATGFWLGIALCLFGIFYFFRERVTVDATHVERRRILAERLKADERISISLAEYVEPKSRRVWHYLRVRSSHGELEVGKHGGLGFDEASWLAAALRKALFDAGS